MEAYGEWRYSSTHSLTSALDGGEWSTYTSLPLFFQGKSPWYPLDGRGGKPQSRSERGGEEKNSSPRRESNPRTSIVQPVAQRYTDWAITVLTAEIKFMRNTAGCAVLDNRRHDDTSEELTEHPPTREEISTEWTKNGQIILTGKRH
jgi:hypothetical protein